MPEQFLHGVELVEIDAGPRPIQTVKSSVIGIVGTAPDAPLATTAALQVALAGGATVTYSSKRAAEAGNELSVTHRDPGANNETLLVSVSAGTSIIVRLATDADGDITTTAAQLKAAIDAHPVASTLVSVAHSSGTAVLQATARLFLAGGSADTFPLNTPVLVAGSRREAAKLGASGTLPAALDAIFDQAGAAVVVVRVEEGANEAATLANIVGGVNTATGDYEGVHALLGAESVLGVSPRILIAPGWTHQRPNGAANPVVAELQGIAERLRAVIIADGPNTTDAAAIAYRGDWGSDRIYMHDPWDLVYDTATATNVARPASARIAGQIAKSDNERGFWWSPSNQEANGIVGTARAVDFTLGDPNCRANLLNEAGIATTIRHGGFRLWGNRTTSADPRWIFLSVRRTADIINDSILRAHLWAVDRNIVKSYIKEVEEGVNAYLRTLVALGAILGGKCWADPDLNTAANISQGKVYFNFDFTPPYPAEHVTFRSMLVNDYISEVL